MPEFARFFGIIIRMFSEPGERHHTPHFHAYYQEKRCHLLRFSGRARGSTMPQRQQRLIEAWAELHQDELLSDWYLLEQGKRPAPIDPLR